MEGLVKFSRANETPTSASGSVVASFAKCRDTSTTWGMARPALTKLRRPTLTSVNAYSPCVCMPAIPLARTPAESEDSDSVKSRVSCGWFDRLDAGGRGNITFAVAKALVSRATSNDEDTKSDAIAKKVSRCAGCWDWSESAAQQLDYGEYLLILSNELW